MSPLVWLMLFCSTMVSAQHPLSGAWEMVSAEGTDFEGKAFSVSTTTNREIKLITPTHFMLISHTVNGDSLIFSRCLAGTVRMDGPRYRETVTTSSWTPPAITGSDCTWKLNGDKFIQAGAIMLNGDRKIELKELVFRRIGDTNAVSPNKIMGAWNQLSSTYTLFDGTKGSHTYETATRFYVYTPDHWMMIGHRDNKFESAMGGSYSIRENKILVGVEVSSFVIDDPGDIDLTFRIDGDKLYTHGTRTLTDGRVMSWDDVYQRVPAPADTQEKSR